MSNIEKFPLSFAFHSQLTASNENDENIEPVLTTPLHVNKTIESTPLADAESRSLPQTIEEDCNSKGNFDHLVNEIGPYPFAPPPGFTWKPKWELSPVDGISGAQPSELLNSTAVMVPHSNKSFEELFLDKVKPPATKDRPKRRNLDNRAQVINFCSSLILRVDCRTCKRSMKQETFILNKKIRSILKKIPVKKFN